MSIEVENARLERPKKAIAVMAISCCSPTSIPHLVHSLPTAKLSDYDVAKHLVCDACDTQVGTMAYVAPERIESVVRLPNRCVELGLSLWVANHRRWHDGCVDDITPLPAYILQGLVDLVNSGCLRKNPADA